ncbi:hypothetical protein PPL_01764 [Heterostelium album PN500]|uniref:Uncharacterized protein n=1 Tax=Heterostelium pallidum (strain ATCC 26659 / Pp 5 / PN500) TaxID=670386 RepID=D3B0E8_HETP5|nr:hypothetical protein PPL_01764 [Heterostelium album PN500]EFA84772.1 hypothetical protein PPL_01764 [Heterostelium album PN500]|eukprot:XP_020436884.1 hypothetical protein PPL_01764 [Heterostelium album PN500]
MSSNIKSNIEAIIKGIESNKILDIFEKYYAEDVVMYEKGDSSNRVGKDQNRKAEEAFVNNATIHEVKSESLCCPTIKSDSIDFEMMEEHQYQSYVHICQDINFEGIVVIPQYPMVDQFFKYNNSSDSGNNPFDNICLNLSPNFSDFNDSGNTPTDNI